MNIQIPIGVLMLFFGCGLLAHAVFTQDPLGLALYQGVIAVCIAWAGLQDLLLIHHNYSRGVK